MSPELDSHTTPVHQKLALRPPMRRKIHAPGQWLPWIPAGRVRRARPESLASPGPEAVQLFWQLPIVPSSPRHVCWTETCEGQPPDYFWSTSLARNGHTVPQAVSLMERRTWQAVATGPACVHGVHSKTVKSQSNNNCLKPLPEPDCPAGDGTSHEMLKMAAKTEKRPTQREL